MGRSFFSAGPRDWASQGECASADPDGFFVQGADQNRVKSFCAPCKVRNLCLADALDNRIEFGIWGGMTERERRKLLRRNPGVTDWSAVIDSAQEQQESLLERRTGS